MDANLPEVEFITAWVWDCPACEEENLCHGDTLRDNPFEPETPEHALFEEDDRRGEYVLQPTHATCIRCGLKVKIKDHGEDL